MSFKKHGLKVLSLSIMAALGLVAFSVSAAQAAHLYRENGVTITGLKNVTGIVDVLGKLEIPKLKSEIDCNKFKVTSGVILGNGHADGSNVGHGELLYEECKGFSGLLGETLTLQANCKLFETQAERNADTNSGNIVAKALFLFQLHSGALFVLVDAHSSIWTRNCLNIPNGTLVSGSFTAKVTNDASGKLLVEVADLTLFPNKLFFGEHLAELLGSVWVSLVSGGALTIATC